MPKSKASIAQNRFEFRLPGEKKVRSVPLLKYLKPSLAMEFEELDEKQAVRRLFEAVYPGEDLFAKFDDVEQFTAWLQAWGDASGVDLGESPASPPSSESTAGPSDTTSSESDSDLTDSEPTT